MFASLKWRIAASYALLLAIAIGAIGVAVVLSFQGILYSQAQARVDQTMREIVRAALPSDNPLLPAEQSGYETVINSQNLARWESPTTYVQIDAIDGSLLARSSNFGSERFASDPALTARTPGPLYRTANLSTGAFLVEDRYLALGPRAIVVHVGEPLDALQRTFEQTRSTIVAILAAAVLALIALAILLAEQITEPINRLTSAMRSTGPDFPLAPRARELRRDEIGQLADSFDDLIDRLGEAFARERQFISDASHELKTPLTSINANAQMLLRWGDEDETLRRESLETIVHESSSLAGMVNGMLTLAKADRGDAIPKEPVALASLVEDAMRGANQRAAEKGLRLRAEPGDEGRILGDPHLLRQLASNLIDNAIKFTETGEVAVRVERDGKSVRLLVRDTGPGIPEDERAQVFDRFYRADRARSRVVPGTGLGLAIVRSIARVHDGTVEAQAAPGGGSLFVATFPAIGFTESQ
ncbi:MAG TPA: HAMP domain-containing sensor histidine kinase [Candidatus Baltobacteraceae bacterium]|jgi:signal transduction histidine kinase